MKCGDVLLILYPFTDISGSKVRPALVVSGDKFNNGEDLILVPISSVLDENDPYVYPITKTHPSFNASGLKYDSFVKWTKPMALSTSIIRRRLGSVDSKTLLDIRAEVRSVFE